VSDAQLSNVRCCAIFHLAFNSLFFADESLAQRTNFVEGFSSIAVI
jgi:hypothetical protein